MKNYINTSKISLISSLVTVTAVIAIFAMPASAVAGGSYYGNGNSYGYGHNSGYSGSGHSYYPTTEPTYYPTGHSSPVTSTNTNTNVNTTVQSTPTTITINNNNNVSGGGYVQPIYTPVYTAPAPVYSYNYSNGYVPTYYQDYDSYPVSYNYAYTSPLSASCSANTTSAAVGSTVYWNSYISGGNGSYAYTWSGSDQIYGSNSSLTVSYNTPGQKYAAVTIYSNGQSVTINCSNTVEVGGTYAYGYGTVQNTSYATNLSANGLDVACAADSKNVNIGAPVTWSVEATGSNGAYRYSWTGTDGLSGSQTTVSTAYETTGAKTASVTVTTPSGQTVTQSCDSPVNVIPAGQALGNQLGRANTRTNLATNAGTNGNNGLSANSLFSLSNIPWGWVAVLIILVLFGTVLYLLFNKHKI